MKTTVILAFLFASLSLYAQNDFRPGFIVTNSNDTLRGMIEYKPVNVIYTKCLFKKTNGDRQSYSPEEINGFGIDREKVFVSRALSEAGDKIFLDKLLSGTVSVYRHGNTFYVEKDKLYKLEEESTVLNQQTTSYQFNKKKYVGVLNYLFIDCGNFSKKVEKVQLRETQLIEIAREYNNCVGGPSSEYEVVSSGPSTNFYVTGAFVSSTFKGTIMARPISISNQSPALGVGIETTNPRTVENLFATIEVMFQPMSFNYTEEKSYVTAVVERKYEAKYSRLYVPIGLKYLFSTRASSPFIRGGYTFNYFMNSTYTYTGTTRYKSASVPHVVSTIKGDGGNMFMGKFWLAAGLQKEFTSFKGFAEIRAERFGGGSNSGINNDENTISIVEEKSVLIDMFSLHLGFIF